MRKDWPVNLGISANLASAKHDYNRATTLEAAGLPEEHSPPLLAIPLVRTVSRNFTSETPDSAAE